MRHHLLYLALIAATSLTACQDKASTANTTAPEKQQAATTSESAQDSKFDAISSEWLDQVVSYSPVYATELGDHRYDAEVDDLSKAGLDKRLEFNKKFLSRLNELDITTLSRENQVDARILKNKIESDIWAMETYQSWQWDPQMYTGTAGSAIYSLMAREFAPLPDRIKSATARMEKIPAIFTAMRENLDPARVPKIHAETVAKQNKGILQLVEQFITPNLDQLQGEDRTRTDAAIAALKKSVDEQQQWLDTTLVPNAKGDFRIGAKLYDEKLKFSLNSALSRQDIKQRAEAEMKRVREQMYTISKDFLKDKQGAPATPEQPNPDEFQKAIEAALEYAYKERPARDKVVDDSKAALAEATAFVRKHDLVTVPNDPVKIIIMPEFQQGVAVAYCDSPGPLDKGLDTYFAISPIPKDWTQAQTDSFLREYNSRMIHLLAIHEAMPGHYLEGAHSVQSKSVLRAVLRSGLFAEGWAVYTERMMTEAGYMDNDPLFRLVQLKFYLRTIANALLDQGVQVDGWDRDKAMHLMTHDAFQQESEAAGKWVRAQLTSAQLPTYFVGVQEHFDTLDAAKKQQGDKFNLKEYNDKMLSYGAPPVRFARQLLLEQPIE